MTCDDGAHIRLLAVDPTARRRGVGHALVKAAEDWAISAGQTSMTTGADPPYFLWPGVPSTETALMCLFERRHYGRIETNYNMDVDLDAIPEDPEGHYLAGPQDRQDMDEFMAANWPNWRAEVLRALDKGNLELAREEGRTGPVSAFCAFEVNRRGLLGPVAVRVELMGQGRGKGVLVGALHELRRRGADRISVVWVGPVLPVCRRRWAGGQRVLRLPQGAGVNLLPVPRRVELTDDLVTAAPAARRLDPSLPAQGYELRIAADGVDLVGGDDAGLFYGEATLTQLARLHGGRLPAGSVHDHPDLAVRGVMLDISRDKVPTMHSLRQVIDRLASLKVNQVQLYSEHTFAYRDHGEVNAAASPLDAAEITELDAFCRARHVELVPNQNCLGHMNRWLAHDRYRPLAIEPDGFVDPFGITRRPMTMEPNNPSSLALVRELLDELLPLFSSHRVHVGLDEAWELPATRIDDFLAWVTTLRGLPELEGREMLMWGDMVSGHPDMVAAPAGGRDGLRVGLRRLVSLRRALRRPGRCRGAVLGRAGYLELAQHPRTLHQCPDDLQPRRRGGPGPWRHRLSQHRLG